LRGYLETGNKKRKSVAGDAGAGVEAGGLQRTVGTLCADTHPGAYSGQDAYTGRLIPQPYTASSFAQYAEGVGTVRASGGDLGGGSETLLTQPIPFDSMSLLGRTPEIDDPRRGFGFGKEGDPMFTITKAHYHGVAILPLAVRRLTPTECLRLQGFPDGWSQIPWKGKPASECPDGPQYKACGNSMAVPVMAFIGKRIAEVEAKGHQS
jgi:DNA (cytosine-5)-methyltransferase 1